MSSYVVEYQNGFAGKKINPAPVLAPAAQGPLVRPTQRFASNSEARKRLAEQAGLAQQ